MTEFLLQLAHPLQGLEPRVIGKKAFRIVRRGTLLLADRAGYSLITLVLGMALARTCTPAQYAAFVLGMSLVYISRTVLRSIVGVPYAVAYQRLMATEKPAYLGSCLIELCLCFLAFGCVLSLLSIMGAHIVRIRSVSVLLVYFFLMAAGGHLSDFMRSVFLAEFRVGLNFFYGLILNGAIAVGLVILFVTESLSIRSSCLLVGTVSLFTALVAIAFFRDRIHIDPGRLREHWRINWAQGRWILASTVAGMLSIRLLPWLTLIWWPEEVVATVGVLTAVACMIRPALEAALSDFTPRLARRSAQHGAKNTISYGYRLTAIALGGGLAYVALVALVGDWVVGVLYSEVYKGHRLTLIVLALAVAVKAGNVPARSLIMALGRAKVLAFSTLLAASSCFGFVFVAVPSWGELGVALCVCLQNAILLLVSLRELGRPVEAREECLIEIKRSRVMKGLCN